MGLKMEQVVILMFGVFSFLVVQNIFEKIACLLGSCVAFIVCRKISKKLSKVSFKSFLNWHFGLSGDLGTKFPKSSSRRVVGE